jgi:hypothetical protein
VRLNSISVYRAAEKKILLTEDSVLSGRTSGPVPLCRITGPEGPATQKKSYSPAFKGYRMVHNKKKPLLLSGEEAHDQNFRLPVLLFRFNLWFSRRNRYNGLQLLLLEIFRFLVDFLLVIVTDKKYV